MWSIHSKMKNINSFQALAISWKKLHHRCLTGSQIWFCLFQTVFLKCNFFIQILDSTFRPFVRRRRFNVDTKSHDIVSTGVNFIYLSICKNENTSDALNLRLIKRLSTTLILIVLIKSLNFVLIKSLKLDFLKGF